MEKIKQYIHLYARSLFEVYKASKLLTFLLFGLILIQSFVPFLTIYSIQEIANRIAVGSAVSFHQLLIPILIWIVSYAYTSVSIPLMKNIEGTLSDKLIEHVNVSMMEKSKRIKGIELFEDAQFYNDIHFINEQASWRPINLVIFGSGILQFSITILSLLVMISQYSWIIAILSIIVIIPNSYTSFKIQQEAFESMVVGSEDVREMQYYSDVLLSSEFAKEARIFHYFDFFIGKYKNKYEVNHQRIMKARFLKMRYSVVFSLLSVVVGLGCILWFIQQTLNQVILIGGVIAFANALMVLNESTASLIEYSSMLYDTLLYMEKYFNFLSVENGVKQEKNEVLNSDFQEIQFQNLSFCYPNQKINAIENISFSVRKGERIAIVGENGSGKTTLMKLLCRFYDLKEGSICFDNKDYKNFDLQSYREKISAVYQDFGKYDLTLRENIALGNLQHLQDDKDLKKVLIQAGLKEFSNQHELDVMLGTLFDGAVNLSGGEWQKMAIARALIADRELLILDEPTASLDPRSEYNIYQSFLELMKEKTVFFITHRLSAVKLADKVLVLKNGKVDGFAPHEQLMRENSYYKEMYEMQASHYQC